VSKTLSVATPLTPHKKSIEPEPSVDSSTALRLLRLPRVKDRVGLGRSSIYALVSSGQFPRPISLGGRAVAWLESDITGWIETKVKAARER
jgi:prophage regulatory protein